MTSKKFVLGIYTRSAPVDNEIAGNMQPSIKNLVSYISYLYFFLPNLLILCLFNNKIQNKELFNKITCSLKSLCLYFLQNVYNVFVKYRCFKWKKQVPIFKSHVSATIVPLAWPQLSRKWFLN